MNNTSQVSFLFDFPELLTMNAEQPSSIKHSGKKLSREMRTSEMSGELDMTNLSGSRNSSEIASALSGWRLENQTLGPPSWKTTTTMTSQRCPQDVLTSRLATGWNGGWSWGWVEMMMTKVMTTIMQKHKPLYPVTDVQCLLSFVSVIFLKNLLLQRILTWDQPLSTGRHADAAH